jgi:hypothetical protein
MNLLTVSNKNVFITSLIVSYVLFGTCNLISDFFIFFIP